jgi:hypothetical protein
MTLEQEVKMRATTIKHISDLTGNPIEPTPENIQQAEELSRQMIEDPKMKVDYAAYDNNVVAYLAGLVAKSNGAIVEELSDLKLYVVNKLVYEIEHTTDSKIKLTALRALGEVDGVDAFKKRSEMTVQIKPIEEVEKELLSVLEGIEYTVVGIKDAAVDA